ncbi:MAG: YggS family pyridoxal phosphate-dependent enzyme [Pyrinomonadaceae bacterium]
MRQATQSQESIHARLASIWERIAECARRAGRAPEEVTLVAVSKTHSAELVREAYAAGARDFGENRVQEAEGKTPLLKHLTGARWHLIGHLQSNKARRAVSIFDVIHSVDSPALVERLERMCAEEGRDRLPVLVQVDLAGEATKAGAAEGELPAIVERLADCQRLHLVGLMTVPPFLPDPEQVRPYFRRLRELRDGLRAREAFREVGDFGAGALSMGMSHDFEVAIEEGATMVRVGISIFGARNKV